MSLRKDYIQRQFEEFGKVLAVILVYKRESDWDKFEKEINEATKKFTALEIGYVETLSNEAFEKEVLLSPTLMQDQKKILATLLFEKMSFYMEKSDEKNYLALKNKCLELYTHLKENFTENEFDLDVHYKLDFLNRI